MCEVEVIHSNLSSVSSSKICVSSYENHIRHIGSKLMFKMGYEGKGLGKHAQGMIDPILVKERPKTYRLGYVQSNGENSQAMKACEATSKRTLFQVLNHKHVKLVFKFISIV